MQKSDLDSKTAPFSYGMVKKDPTFLKNSEDSIPRDLVGKVMRFVDGEIEKDSSHCWIASGTATHCTGQTLADIKSVFLTCPQNVAFTLGVPKALPDGGKLRFVSKKAAKPGDVTRSLIFWEMPNGRCLVLADYDPRKGEQSLTLEQFRDEMLRVFPFLAGCEMLLLGSTSSEINLPDGSSTQNGGIHCYMILQDSGQLQHLRELLHIHAWLNGCGWILVDKSGRLHVRGLVDDAVFSPERLIFECPPVLLDGLTASPRQYLLVDGGDITELPEVSESDRDKVAAMIDAAKFEKRPVAEETEKKFKAEAVEKMRKTWGSRKMAEATVNRAINKQELSGAWPIRTAEFGVITAMDILKNPEKYEGCVCIDPMETDNGREWRGAIFINQGA